MIRLALLIVLVAAPVHAGTVGVVITGDSELQPALTKQLEAWLRSHGHTLGEALPDDAKSSLLNCMVIDDAGCARGIVDARAKTDNLVFAEIRKPRTRASNATTLIVYWLAKGKEPVGMRRSCEDCTADLLQSTVDEVLRTVVGSSDLPRGRLSLHSKPEGASVMLDNEAIGITPLEREVPAGTHTIVLMRYGRKVAERTIKIHPEVTAEITLAATGADETPPPAQPSRLLPVLALGVGGTAVIAGAVLYLTSETDDGTKPFYRETRPAGIGFAAGGLVLVGLGTWLWMRTDRGDSAPVAAIDQHGGVIGWAGAF